MKLLNTPPCVYSNEFKVPASDNASKIEYSYRLTRNSCISNSLLLWRHRDGEPICYSWSHERGKFKIALHRVTQAEINKEALNAVDRLGSCVIIRYVTCPATQQTLGVEYIQRETRSIKFNVQRNSHKTRGGEIVASDRIEFLWRRPGRKFT